MARARNIKPGFYKNEDLAECSIWARYIYPGIWQLADREGRLEDRPKRIKGELLPFDEQPVEKLLQELQDRKFILRYEVDGKRYIQVLKFAAHQNPHHKERPAGYPVPPDHLLKSLGLVLTANGYEPGAPDLLHGLETSGYRAVERGVNRADSVFLNPDSLTPDSGLPIAESGGTLAARAPGHDGEPKTGPAWEAFTTAYLERYGFEPTRNAVENAAMAAFVKLVPLAEAPEIAAFYVRHNKAWYVQHQHSAKYLRQDAAGLRTQWQAGRQVTETQARQGDRTATVGSNTQRLLAERRKVVG